MKTLSLLSLLLFISANAHATPAQSEQYVCTIASAVDAGNQYTTADIQRAFNSLNCNTTKPVSTTPLIGQGWTPSVAVCCVSK